MSHLKLLTHNASNVTPAATLPTPLPSKLLFTEEQCASFRKCEYLVCIGIGGSYAGLKLLDSFISADTRRIGAKILFARNMEELLALNLSHRNKNAFAITSKSGKTPEINECIDYVVDEFPYAPICFQGANNDECMNIPIPDNVGGRFSVWATLFPIAVSYGMHVATDILYARLYAATDQQVIDMAATASAWDMHSLIAGATGKCVLVYDLPFTPVFDYVQQLEMESLGKRRSSATGNIVFGGYGPNLQHSIMQLLHEGSSNISSEFIVVKRDSTTTLGLWANASAQSNALRANVHRSESLIWVVEPTVYGIVSLLAMYEIRTVATANALGINPFDQPGVELGKVIAKELIESHTSGTCTDALLRML